MIVSRDLHKSFLVALILWLLRSRWNRLGFAAVWVAGVRLFGPLTREGLLAGLYDGLRLATIIICVGAANSLANPAISTLELDTGVTADHPLRVRAELLRRSPFDQDVGAPVEAQDLKVRPWEVLIDGLVEAPMTLAEIAAHPGANYGEVFTRRWVVERSFAWLTRFRRLAKDYERLASTLKGMHLAAFAFVMLARLANWPESA